MARNNREYLFEDYGNRTSKHTFCKRLKEGPGAGYKIMLKDLELDLESLEIVDDSDFDTDVKFKVNVKKGNYGFSTKHSYWCSEGTSVISGTLYGYYEGEIITKRAIKRTLPRETTIEDWYGGGWSTSFPGENFVIGDSKKEYSIGEDWYVTFILFEGYSEDLGIQISDAFEDWYSNDEYEDDPSLEDDLEGVRGDSLGESKKKSLKEYLDRDELPFFEYVCKKYKISPTEKIERMFSMLMSVYAYGSNNSDEEILNNRYLKEYNTPIKIKKAFLTELRKYCIVKRGTYTDSEGCTYNSLEFSEFPNEENLKENKRVKESSEWYDKLEILENEVGANEALMAICKGMSSDDLKDYLDYIARVYELNVDFGEVPNTLDKGDLIEYVYAPIDTEFMDAHTMLDLITRAMDKWVLENLLDSIFRDYDISLDEKITESYSIEKSIMNPKFANQMLGRWVSDCKYILGSCQDATELFPKTNPKGALKHLWAGSVDEQISLMRKAKKVLDDANIQTSVSYEDIDNFEKELKNLEGLRESKFKEENNDRYYGLESVRFIWHGEWSDPELEYEGHYANEEAVEETLWSYYTEWCKEEGTEPNEEQFSDFVRANEDDVIDLILEYSEDSEVADNEDIDIDGTEVYYKNDYVGYLGKGSTAIFNALNEECPQEVIDYFTARDFTIKYHHYESSKVKKPKLREEMNDDPHFIEYVDLADGSRKTLNIWCKNESLFHRAIKWIEQKYPTYTFIRANHHPKKEGRRAEKRSGEMVQIKINAENLDLVESIKK